MKKNKVQIIVTTSGRLFFIEDNPEMFGFMDEDEHIRKRIMSILPIELSDFFDSYSSSGDIGIENLFKNAFINWVNARVRKSLNGKFKNNARFRFNNITGDIVKNELSKFDKKLYSKLMHIVLNLASSIVKLFKNDFNRIRRIHC